MKPLLQALMLVALFAVGCVYEVPLTTDHTIPVDPAVLGLWELVPDEGKEPDPVARMLVLKFSDTEYLIHYPIGKDGLYYRGYPVKAGKRACVQLQVIGSKDGLPGKKIERHYQVVSCELIEAQLELKVLNPERVDADLADSPALMAAFLKQQDQADLFMDPARFRRVEAP